VEVCLVIKRRLEELGLDGRSDGCRRGDGVLHCWSRYGKYNDFNVYGLFGRDRRFRILRIGGKVLLNRREVERYKPKRTGRPAK
jgi:hypothetical protein